MRQTVRGPRGFGSYWYNERERRWRGRVFGRGGVARWVSGHSKADIRRQVDVLLEARSRRSPNRRRTLRFGAALNEWLQSRVDLKPQTVALYQSYIDDYIAPALGHLALEDLDYEDFEQFKNELIADFQMATVTVQHMLCVMRMTLRREANMHGVELHMPSLVPTVRADERSVGVALTQRQARKLVEAIRGNPYEAAYLLAATTGMRSGEIRALRWRDLDLESATGSVSRTVARDPQRGPFEQSVPKQVGWRPSSHGIVLVPVLVTLLDRTRAAQRRNPRHRADGSDDALVFPGAHGCLLAPATLLRHLHVLCAQNDLPAIRLHDLRHSANTLLKAWGVSEGKRQELLGHAPGSPVTAGTYDHETEDTLRGVRRALSDIYGELVTAVADNRQLAFPLHPGR